MSKLVIISAQGEGYGIAEHLNRGGCKTAFVSREAVNNSSELLRPSIQRNWRAFTGTAETVIFTTNGYDRLTTTLREAGKNTLGGMSPELLDDMLDSPPESDNILPIIMGRWFIKDKWVGPYYAIYEYSWLMENNKGPMTTSGYLIWLEDTLPEHITNLFDAFTDQFTEEDYNGFFQIGYAFTPDSHPAIAFASQMNPTAIQVAKEVIRTTWEGYFASLCNQRHPKYHTKRIAVGVHVTAPPHPYAPSVIPKATIPPKAMNHIYTDPTGYWITAYGEDSREARTRALRTINNMNTPPATQFRTDIGLGFEKIYQLLIDWGHINAT